MKVGGLSEHKFLRGYYAYTGSALGDGASSLRKRVTRHLQKEKNKFWHIDYFLVLKGAVVTAIVAAYTNKKMECKINSGLKNEVTARIPVFGFGASDCKENCGSHFLYFGEKNVKQKIAFFYTERLGRKNVVVI